MSNDNAIFLMLPVILLLSTCQAQAQQICAPRATLIEKLKAEFNEEPEAVGVTTSGGLFEVMTSETGTWTVLATGSNGVSCLVLSGEGWTNRLDKPASPVPTGKRRNS